MNDDTRRRIDDAFPSSWLDSLLTGPDAVLGPPPYWCPDIERLLAAVKARVIGAAAPTPAVGWSEKREKAD